MAIDLLPPSPSAVLLINNCKDERSVIAVESCPICICRRNEAFATVKPSLMCASGSTKAAIAIGITFRSMLQSINNLDASVT